MMHGVVVCALQHACDLCEKVSNMSTVSDSDRQCHSRQTPNRRYSVWNDKTCPFLMSWVMPALQ